MKFVSLFVLFGLLGFMPRADAQDNYRTYRNARFGTSVQYPAHLLLPQRESSNGDGRKFLSRDGRVELTVYGFNNSAGRSASGEMNRAVRDWKRDKAQITYAKAGNGWFVLSGYVGRDIFYEKTIARGSTFHTLIWQYPAALKRSLDVPLTRSVRTFTALRPTVSSVPRARPQIAAQTPEVSAPREDGSGY
jgi:hypothetical protein